MSKLDQLDRVSQSVIKQRKGDLQITYTKPLVKKPKFLAALPKQGCRTTGNTSPVPVPLNCAKVNLVIKVEKPKCSEGECMQRTGTIAGERRARPVYGRRNRSEVVYSEHGFVVLNKDLSPSVQ